MSRAGVETGAGSTTEALVLTTARLTLRLPTIADAARVVLMLNDFAVAGNLARVPYPYRLGDAQAYLRLRSGTSPAETAFAIDLPGEGFIGQVGFHTDPAGRTVLGYYLGQPYWGQGYMTEAAIAALDWYFAATSDDTIRSGVFHFNTASLAVQHKLGFKTIATSTLHCLARDEEVRHIDTALTRAAWEKRQS